MGNLVLSSFCYFVVVTYLFSGLRTLHTPHTPTCGITRCMLLTMVCPISALCLIRAGRKSIPRRKEHLSCLIKKFKNKEYNNYFIISASATLKLCFFQPKLKIRVHYSILFKPQKALYSTHDYVT